MIRNSKYITKYLLMLTSIAALCVACDEEEKKSEPCVDGTVLCEENALSVCNNGSWDITICKDEKPICDIESASCLEDPDALCVASKCTLPEHAAQMACRFDQCIVAECETGFDVAENKTSCQKHVECHEDHGVVEVVDGECHIKSCNSDYALDVLRSKCIPASDCNFTNGVGDIVDGVCTLISCNEGYEKSESATECIELPPKKSCQALDGNVPIEVKHDGTACDGNTPAKCNDGVLVKDDKDCDKKVCRYDTGSKKFGCYKAVTTPACTIEDYQEKCAVANAASIDGCRSHGVCAFTCKEGYVDTGSNCIIPPKCATTDAQLTDALNTVKASGTAELGNDIAKTLVFCTNDLSKSTRNWNSYDGSFAETDSNITISATGEVLGEGDNYCVVAVITSDNNYFFCPASNSNTTAIYSTSSTYLSADQAVKIGNTCGNGKLDANEKCDGTLLNRETCASQTSNDKMVGTLKCSLCKEYDLSGCVEQDNSVGALIFSFIPAEGCTSVVKNNTGISAGGCTFDESTGKTYDIVYDAGYGVSINANGKLSSNINLYATTNYIKLTALPNNIVVKAELTGSANQPELGVTDNGSTPNSKTWIAEQSAKSFSFKASSDATEVTIQPTKAGKVLVSKIEVYEAKLD